MKQYLLSLFFLFLLILQAQEQNIGPATEEEFIADAYRYVQLLSSTNPLVCQHALEYIPYFGQKAIPALQQGLQSENPNVRAYSAVALSQIPNMQVIPALIHLLSDNNTVTLTTLSDQGDRVHASHDMTLGKYVYRSALHALHSITQQHFGYFNENDEIQKQLQKKWQQWWDENKDTFQLPTPKAPFSNKGKLEQIYPIPDYAKYIQGKIICLDPGHGGDGHIQGYKRSATGNREAESNLRLARYLSDFLQQCGANVILTRNSDKDISLADRAKITVSQNADIFLSIHHNWSYRYTAQATTIWYHQTPDTSPSSLDLGRHVFQQFTQQVPLNELDKTGGLKSDSLMYQIGFGVLRNTAPYMPAILCELAFFSNLETELLLRNNDFLQKEAYGIFLGIAQYFYAGIPDFEVINITENTTTPIINIQLYDGLEKRGEWRTNKISARHLVVEIDNQSSPYILDTNTNQVTISIEKPLTNGEHILQLYFYNQNKNHNRPKRYIFQITDEKQ
ncbi:MAG TPA: N-acetylmuramoyl-L-alanine amidase [Planctomycetota bacterium]|nr:N-acetylmuramoyl-L-alanine amidase [Planctomycetota bacterium]